MRNDFDESLKSVADIRLPDGVTMTMVEAGMKEWDAQMKAGQRQWPNMLGEVYVAMSDVAPKVKRKKP